MVAQHATAAAQRQAVLALVLSRPPEHPPLSRFHYSNVGYAILSAIGKKKPSYFFFFFSADSNFLLHFHVKPQAENALAQPWEDIVTARLKDPLGMASLRFGGPTVRKEMNKRGKTGWIMKWIQKQLE